MTHSSVLFEQAEKFIPGGVNSPVRAFKGVGGTPIFIDRAHGPYLYDTLGKQYIDYVGSWGPMILGHAHPKVIEAVSHAIKKGLSFGTPTEIETQLAEKICTLVPSIEKVRMVNSGTEATMSAVRLARGYTGRSKIVKFEGCYHGHGDSFLIAAGSGALTLGVPTSPGVPVALAKETLVLPYNDIERTQETFAKQGEDIACVIVEPIAGNMNCILPKEHFLETLRNLCDEYSSVLIFDEVMTGFRVGLGGAQTHYGIRPDLTTLGKIIGGGMPVGAYGGHQEIMDRLAPSGDIYQAGTLSGNPIAMTAGLHTLKILEQENFYPELEQKTQTLLSGLEHAANHAGIPFHSQQAGSMFGLFFAEQKVHNLSEVQCCDEARFQRFFHHMLRSGIYFAPSAYEAGFVSQAHTQATMDATCAAAEAFFQDENNPI